MAKKKGEVEIVFSGDTKDLKKDLTNIGDVSKKEFEKAEKASKSFFDSIGGKAAKIGLAGITAVGIGVSTIGVKSLKAASNLQDLNTEFEVLTGSVSATKELVNSIDELANSTPLENMDLAGNVKTLLAFGSGLSEVVDQTRMLGDLAMGDQEKLNRLADAFGKTNAKGKASMEELNRFTEAGVPILRQLSEQYGKTTEEIIKMSSNGKIGFGDVEKAMISLTSEGGQFFDMMKKKSDTASGAASTLSGILTSKLAKGSLVAMEPLKDMLNEITQEIIGGEESFNSFGESVALSIKAMTPALKEFTSFAIKGLDTIGDIMKSLSQSGTIAGQYGVNFDKAQAEMAVLEVEADQGRQKLREFAEAIAEADKSGKSVTFDGVTTSVEVARKSFGFASKAVQSMNEELNFSINKYSSVGIAFESTADDIVESAKKIEQATGESLSPNSNKLSKGVKEKKEKKGKEVDFQEVLRRNKEIEDEKLDYVYEKQIEKEEAELQSIKKMKEEKLLAISEAHDAEMQSTRDLQAEFDSMQSGLQKSVSDPIIDGIFEAAEEGKSIMGTIFDNLKSSAKSGIANSLSGILSGGLASLATGNPFSVLGTIGSAFGFASGGPVGDNGFARVNESERIYTAQDHSQVKQLTSAVNALISGGGSSNNTFNISGAGSPQATAFAIKRMNDNVSRRKVPNRMAEVY